MSRRVCTSDVVHDVRNSSQSSAARHSDYASVFLTEQPQATPSNMVRVLMVGATGTIGQEVARACAGLGHEVFALVRADSKSAKSALIAELSAAGIQFVDGDLQDSASVDAAFRSCHPIEAVVSAVAGRIRFGPKILLLEIVQNMTELPCTSTYTIHAGAQVADQINLIRSSQKAQTVKRFLPSEFGVVHTTAKADVPEIVGARISMFQEIQAAGLPYTLVHSNGFMEDWFSGRSASLPLCCFASIN